MSAAIIGLATVAIYASGVFMGLWIGRGKSNGGTSNWRGAVPKSDKAPPKPPHNPHK